MENKGAIDWTVGKLLSLILLVIVLVLVVYGVSTKGLNPLIDRTGDMMDNVLILFNIREEVSDECYSPNVASLSDGPEFLSNLGIESGSEEIKIDICKNNICTLVLGGEIGIYRLNNGVFEKKGDGSVSISRYASEETRARLIEEASWNSYEAFLSGNLDVAKFRWELYNGALDSAGEGFLDGTYGKMFTKQFVLIGVDWGGHGNIDFEATWNYGKWRVNRGEEILYEGQDSEKALDNFLSGVTDDAWTSLADHDVYYKTEIAKDPDKYYLRSIEEDLGKSIGELIGSKWYDLEDKISESEKPKFKEKVLEEIEKILSDSKASQEIIDELKDGLPESITVDEKVFVFDVVESERLPVITLTSGDERYALEYNPTGKIESDLRYYLRDPHDINIEYYFRTVALRKTPMILVKWRDSSWRDADETKNYKLPKKYFDEAYESTLINNFIRSRCK